MTGRIARIELGRPLGRDFPRGLLGHFIENMAHSVYRGGLMAERGQESDVGGTRKRIVELLAALRPSILRWPGGLFADGYQWWDGVGPLHERMPTPNRYWRRYGPLFGPRDPHSFGTLEFAALCRRVDAQPYINLNLGTGTPEDAAAWAEYCTAGSHTFQGGRRVEHGHPEPINVRLWGLGNEAYGFWSLGHCDAETYARRYLRFREALDAVAPGGECVAVGADMDWPDWNARLLEIAGDKVDVLSIHTYLPSCNKLQNLRFLHMASRRRMLAIMGCAEEFAARIDAISERVRGVLGSRPLRIALDEWGLWWWIGQTFRANWRMRDAVSLAATLHLLAERPQVEWATYAQFINVLGLIKSWPDRVIPSPLYHMFQLYSRLAKRRMVGVKVDGPTFDAPGIGVTEPRRNLPKVLALATMDDAYYTTLFLVNRDVDSPVIVQLDGPERKFKPCAVMLDGPGPLAANTLSDPAAVRPIEMRWQVGDSFQLPPCSIAVLGADLDGEFVY